MKRLKEKKAEAVRKVFFQGRKKGEKIDGTTEGKRIWKPRQQNGENKNIKEKGGVRGWVYCGRWLNKRDNEDRKEDSFQPSQHSEPWVILLLYFNGLWLFFSFSLTALVVPFRWERKKK